MKKFYGYFITILIFSVTVLLVNLIAYYDDGTPDYPGGVGSVPLINSFDTTFLSTEVPTPPYGPFNEYVKWRCEGEPTPAATATREVGGVDIGNTSHGIDYAKISWRDEGQYIALDGEFFENVGCTGGPGSDPDPAVYDPADAPNWECYDYVVFDMYSNFNINGDIYSAEQKASLVDSSGVTFTSFGMNVIAQSSGGGAANWAYKVSMSLNYIANHYDDSEGKYFSVDDVAEFIINAPVTSHYQGGAEEYIMYYDHLTLGAGIDPNAPAEIASLNATTVNSAAKMEINWIDSAGGGTSPITGYHIYRATGPEGPYRSVDFASNTQDLYTDDTIPLGGMDYCYKVLAMDNGPGELPDSGNQISNTINATYNEARLADATPMCEYMPFLPTSTPTATQTVDLTMVTLTHTPTITPTCTYTPVAEGEINARVYPNPFNPNMGSKKFYTDQVPDGSKISIYAMDGSLVEDGEIEGEYGRFEWDGKNKNGSKVVSGLYYLVVEPPEDSGQGPKVYRIIVCYKCDTTYEPE